MQARQQIIAAFSTFIQFTGDRFHQWLVEPKLRRSMQHCLEQSRQTGMADLSEQFWVLYWHRRWQADSNYLATGHLSAYLQEACYWAAQRTISRLPNTQYGLSDCFQTAIANLPIVLKGYNATQEPASKPMPTLFLRIRFVIRCASGKKQIAAVIGVVAKAKPKATGGIVANGRFVH